MKFLANPFLLRSGVVLFFATFSFLMGLIFIRLLRKAINDEADIETDTKPSLETLPLHVYSTVIQQLKQQKHELIAQSQAEQNRLRTSETFHQALLSNLSCGVLVFGTNGLIKSSNPAAKEILGFASITGMGAEDIFRGTLISDSVTEPVSSEASEDNDSAHDEDGVSGPIGLADEIEAVLREGSRRQVQAKYETPAGEKRYIAVTFFPVQDAEGSPLGVACLIDDLNRLERVRKQQTAAQSAAAGARG